MKTRNPAVRLCLWMYRRLAEAFPHDFKRLHGDEVIELSEDVVEEIWRAQGILGLVRLVADVVVRVPAEHLSDLKSDIRYAFRTLAREPGFVAVAVLSLGLSIGINTTAFSELNAMIYRDLCLWRRTTDRTNNS